MKKTVLTMFLVLLAGMLVYGLATTPTADAKVTKQCAVCHTMHNSQNGAVVASGGPYDALLNRGAAGKTSCWGCHAEGSAVNVNTTTGAPQIMHTNATDLAGGNFGFITGASGKTPVTGNTLTVGHNVKDTAVTDTILTAPPGDQHSTGITNANFTCAGQYGCHGDRTATSEAAAVKGAHHANDDILKLGGTFTLTGQAGSTGLSYRFLNGVKGGEDSDWQATSNTTDHNEYFGATSMGASSATAPASNTISGLCAECHGNFHGTGAGETGGSASPWKRHPTDIALPGTGEYASYTTYSLTAPVGRSAMANAFTAASNTTNGVVMCISCHRAHASAYEDMLRWDYTGMVAGTTGGTAGTGCFVCHTTKDGV